MSVFLHAYVFYLLAALAICIYRQWLDGKLGMFNKVVFAPVLVGFTLLDILLNYTLMVPFFGFPNKKEYTISSRFETYRTSSTGYKWHIATFVCDRLSEIDPSGRHC